MQRGWHKPRLVPPTHIRTLAKVLQEHPGLSFEIEGGADPQRDRRLRALAQKRANAVLAALSQIAPEGATRRFLVTPHLGPKDGAAGNSVELRLKKD
jgi:hypothetical protein